MSPDIVRSCFSKHFAVLERVMPLSPRVAREQEGTKEGTITRDSA
jgi:hypothetical protein